jgi:hypothetical protein
VERTLRRAGRARGERITATRSGSSTASSSATGWRCWDATTIPSRAPSSDSAPSEALHAAGELGVADLHPAAVGPVCPDRDRVRRLVTPPSKITERNRVTPDASRSALLREYVGRTNRTQCHVQASEDSPPPYAARFTTRDSSSGAFR